MTDEATHITSANFFTLGVRIKKGEMTILRKEANKSQSKASENKWIQEY